MSRKAKQFFILFLSLVITIALSILWLYLNKKGLANNITIDSDLKNMLFNRALGIVIIMSFVYFIGSLITFITGVKLKIFGG